MKIKTIFEGFEEGLGFNRGIRIAFESHGRFDK